MRFFERFRNAATTVTGLFLIGAICFFTMNSVKNQADWIVKDTLTGLSYAGKSVSSLTESFNRVLLAVNSPSAPEREGFLRELDEFDRTTDEYEAKYLLAIFLDADRQNFGIFSGRLKKYQKQMRQVAELARNNRITEAQGQLHSELLPAFRQCMAAADKLLDYNVELGAQRGAEIIKSCRRTQFLFAALGTLLFAAGFTLAIFRYVFFPMFREN